MVTGNTTKAAHKLPTLRDVFDNSDLTECTTEEYDKLTKELDIAIKAVCKTFEEFNNIDVLATGKAVEAQALGFEQGVAFALSILGESRSYTDAQIGGIL